MSPNNQMNESNTTDATTGQGLRARVEARRAELRTAIASGSTNARTRGELENALGQIEGLLTGDLDRIPRVVAEELSTWLEASKHLDERHPRVLADGGGAHDAEDVLGEAER